MLTKVATNPITDIRNGIFTLKKGIVVVVGRNAALLIEFLYSVFFWASSCHSFNNVVFLNSPVRNGYKKGVGIVFSFYHSSGLGLPFPLIKR